MAEGRVPAREVLDGALVIFGGAFLITPGFITDVIGFFLLLPPTRAVTRRALVGVFSRRFFAASLAGGAASRMRRRRPPPHEGYDVEGRAVEVDPPAVDPPR
jgi:UPF0716 protein FxsA